MILKSLVTELFIHFSPNILFPREMTLITIKSKGKLSLTTCKCKKREIVLQSHLFNLIFVRSLVSYYNLIERNERRQSGAKKNRN